MTPSNARSLAVTTMQKAGIILLVLVFVGCSQIDAPPVTSAQTQTASDGATGLIAPTSANEQRWRIDPRTSMALIYTYKGGKLARFGHNHVIAAHALTGTVILTETVSGSRFALTIPVSELSVDEAPLRRRASAAFDSEPSPEDIAATRTNMLG